MAWELLGGIVQSAIQRGSRSTVLNTLAWMAALLSAALVGSVTAQAKDWIQVFFAVTLGIDFLAFIAAFWFFAVGNPDALRSERFSIEKMAIERGLYGDSRTGLVEHPDTGTPLIEAKAGDQQ